MRQNQSANKTPRYDAELECYRAEFDPDSEAVTDVLVRMMGDVTGEDIAELEPMDSVVDPVVFDALLRRRRRDVQIRFVYCEHEVTVHTSGEIVARQVHTDGGRENHAVTVEGSESATDAIVQALADVKGVDVTELDPLYDDINPDTIEELFRQSSDETVENLTVSFEIDGLHVRITSDSRVAVRVDVQSADR